MEFFAIITLASSVLSIILFFKIWGMTNDVKFIRNNIESGIDYSCLVTGDKEEAKKMLATMFINDARAIHGHTKDGSMDKNYATKRIKELAADYTSKANAVGVEVDFDAAAADLLQTLEILSK